MYEQMSFECWFVGYLTHTHHFSGVFQMTWVCQLDFVFALVLNLCILLELAKTFHVLGRPLWLSSVAWLE